MKLKLHLLILFITSTMFAQQEYCGTDRIAQSRILETPSLVARKVENEQFTRKWIANYEANNRAIGSIITIPVVIHVLYKTSVTNISDAQINSQFIALNNYFRGVDQHFDTKTPSVFKPLKADAEIEFCLAKRDANGNETTGIVRKQVTSTFNIENDYYDATKGSVAWDLSKYLNIWVVDYGTDGTNGSATDPASGQNYGGDGALLDYRAFGTIEKAVSDPSRTFYGKVVAHEIGHYLNLMHPWGGTMGGCNEDDGVADTPNQKEPSGTCTFPLYDTCTTSGDGLMYVNYMDYTPSDCTTMFTIDQKSRMLAALNGLRSGLKISNGCQQVLGVSDNELGFDFNVLYLNKENHFQIQLNSNRIQGELLLSVYNVIGQMVFKDVINKTDNKYNYKLNLENQSSGVNIIKISGESGVVTKKVIVK